MKRAIDDLGGGQMGGQFEPDYRGALVRPSPNFEARRQAAKPQFIILHYTGLTDSESAEMMLTDPNSKVSAHYLVREDGTIIQHVSESLRAWHAGVSCWQSIRDVNSHSIGIEIANAGPLLNFPPFPAAQIAAVIDLCLDIMQRHGIVSRNVIGHSDIAPERRIDPGPMFPWHQLAARSIGHYVQPTEIQIGCSMTRGESGRPIEAYQSLLALLGYDIAITSIFDERTEIVTKAFQRHFRQQKIDGVADFSTVDTLHKLLATLSVL